MCERTFLCVNVTSSCHFYLTGRLTCYMEGTSRMLTYSGDQTGELPTSSGHLSLVDPVLFLDPVYTLVALR